MNVASVENKPADAPYLCPHCDRPANLVAWSANTQTGLLIFFHSGPEGCRRVINCQLTATPKMIAKPNLIV